MITAKKSGSELLRKKQRSSERQERSVLPGRVTAVFLCLASAVSLAHQPEGEFRDERHGFELIVPAEYTLTYDCRPDEGLDYGDLKSGAGKFVADVDVMDAAEYENFILNSEKYFKDKTYETFAIYQAKLRCDAIGPMGTSFCDEVVQQKSYLNRNGVRTVEFYLTHVSEIVGRPVARRTVGPIYGLFLPKLPQETQRSYLLLHEGRLVRVSLEDTFRILLIFPDFESELRPVNAEVLQQMAESVRLIPVYLPKSEEEKLPGKPISDQP